MRESLGVLSLSSALMTLLFLAMSSSTLFDKSLVEM